MVKTSVFPEEWSSKQLQEFLGTDGEGIITVEGGDIAQSWNNGEKNVQDSILVEVFAKIASSTGVHGKIWYRLMESTTPGNKRNWEWTSAPVNEKEAMELVPEGIPWKTSGLVRLRSEILGIG